MIQRTLLLSLSFSMVFSWPALAQSVDELVNHHLEAVGVEKAKAVKSVKISGKMLMLGLADDKKPVGPGKESAAMLQIKRPNLIRLELNQQGQGMVVEAFDGENSWGLRPGSTEPEMLADDEGGLGEIADMFLKEMSDLDGPLVDYKDKWNKVELAGKENVDGTETYKLKLSPKDGFVRYIFLDTKTFNAVKVTRPGSEFLMETCYTDYKPINGRPIPHTVESRIDGQMISKLTLERVEMNVALDDSVFKQPTKP